MKRKREQLRGPGSRRTGRVVRVDLLAGLPDVEAGFVEPMQCRLVDRLPVGQQWLYELKLDGYRALAVKTAQGVRLISRNRKDLSASYPELIDAVRQLPMRQGILDGEIVALDATGRPSFQGLQHARGGDGQPCRIVYFAFDLLNLEGKATLALPLLDRKRLLEEVLRAAPGDLRLLPAMEAEPAEILEAVEREGLEGVVAKLSHSLYEPGKRTGAWGKLKLGHSQEFVIGGFTKGQGGRSDFGALIVGFYEEGQLRYASKVGTGFSAQQIRQILDKSAALRRPDSPFPTLPSSRRTRWSYGLTAAERKTAVWLEPVLVCEVRFTEWTQDGHLRHPAFQGLRDDKEAREVVRERPK